MIIELEHTLIMLFLLAGLLNARPKLPKLVQWGIWAGLALALVAPIQPIPLPWDWLAGLAIPLFIWQNARRLVNARWFERPVDIFAWAGIALGIVALLYVTANLPLTAGIVFGFLVASMVWRALEEEHRPSFLGQVGPLALAFLLVEIAPAVEAPGHYFIALIAGSALGSLTGYLAVEVSSRLGSPLVRDLLAVAQAYLAYGVAIWLGVSGVAAAVLSVAVFITYGVHRGLWPDGNVQPRPLNSPFVFVPAVIAFAFFGWQTHVPLTPLLLLEIGISLALVGVVIWVSRSTGRGSMLHGDFHPIRLLRVGLLITAALLLWPRDVLLDPIPLALALATAGLAIAGTQYSLTPLIHLAKWLDESDWGEVSKDLSTPQRPVEELMSSDISMVHPDTPLPVVAHLLLEQPNGCVPVVDSGDRMVGIISEADLFVKEKRLPQTDQIYPSLFGVPIKPGELMEIYTPLGMTRLASDVMTRQVVWVKPSHTIDYAIRLMTRHGFKCLPVLTANPQEGGRVLGLISRSALVRLLAESGDQQIHKDDGSTGRSQPKA